jgi:hypothetical protein
LADFLRFAPPEVVAKAVWFYGADAPIITAAGIATAKVVKQIARTRRLRDGALLALAQSNL